MLVFQFQIDAVHKIVTYAVGHGALCGVFYGYGITNTIETFNCRAYLFKNGKLNAQVFIGRMV
jgi:hypothetical protein